MSMVRIKKAIMAGLVAALALASVPLTGVYAAHDQAGGERLERLWARRQRAYDRQGRILDGAGDKIERVQGLIDKAGANGIDVAALQSALDAFEQAVKEAHPIHESGKGIINSHKGFDDDGGVTDAALAAQTVQDLSANLQSVRDWIATPGKALREALKAFREANKPPEPVQEGS